MRLMMKDLVEKSGFCRDTVKRLADSGVLPHQRDMNGWRIFLPEALEIAKELAGLKDEELRDTEADSR